MFRDRLTHAELHALLERIDLAPRDVLSKRSRAYRELGLDQRDLTDAELIDLMVADPTLIRRPLIVDGAQVVVGFNRDEIETLIQQSGSV